MSNIKDLLSEQFQTNIEKLFFGDHIRSTIGVINITRAYNVYLDLKAGIEFSQIDYHRLVSFHLFLQKYVSIFRDDKIDQLYIELKKFLEIK